MHTASDLRYKRWTLAYLLLFGLTWWAIFSLTRHALDHADMVENYVWGTAWQWGNNKHPPLFGWITAAWFHLFPTRDWAYYLLEEANLVLALWWLALAMRRCLPWDRVLVGVVLTSLVTLYGADSGYKYNANTAQLPFIAGFAWSLLHALQGRRLRWFALAGAFAGAALLSKYSALLLLAAVALPAALALRPPLRTLVAGGALAAAVAGALFLPHVLWSIRHGWPSLHYMHSVHQASSAAGIALAHLTVLVSALLYCGLTLLVWALARFQLPATAAAPPSVASPTPRLGGRILLAALVLTLSGALLERVTPVPPWLIPVLLFAGWALAERVPDDRDTGLMARRVLIAALAWLVLMALAAGGLEMRYRRTPAPPPYVLPQTMAVQVETLYRQAYGAPIEYAAGSFPLPYFLAFYGADHPRALYGFDLAQSTWIDPEALRAGNKVALCGSLRSFAPPPEPACAARAAALFGPPDQTRTLQWRVYDPGSRRQALQTVEVLMWKPRHPVGAAD
ncbi:MAG: glycosyltransferase family 39 protein [Stenotrophomonas sp.]|nr:glycosyltransferase family 39 protein [Xanthomonadales bacterium]MBN8768229.1 glycosyltransferase family 39 protein [Stenotrophomonas sp.]